MKTLFIAGHQGMVGSALRRRLTSVPGVRLLTAARNALDLRSQSAVEAFFARHEIDEVILAAARVGGIHANDTYPAQFIYDNLMIAGNVIQAAHAHGVQKLLYLGSSCIYPRDAAQPMREEALLSGALEPTNAPYAVAKIAGITLCASYNRQYGRDYRSVMPTNLYGPGDNYHPENSHVIPGLIRRFHEAVHSGQPEMVIWGSGRPLRDFMHVDDMAAAAVHVMNLDTATWRAATGPQLAHLNVGTGRECSIREVAERLADIAGFTGRLVFDSSKPDGTPRKLMDVSRLQQLGWTAEIGLEAGLRDAWQWYEKWGTDHGFP